MRADLQNRDTCVPMDLGFSSKIGAILSKSGLLDTLEVFKGVQRNASQKEKRNIYLSSSNCWKCIEIVNPTMLFCIILNLL